MTIRTTLTNDGSLMNMAAGPDDLFYVLVTIITEFWFILVKHHRAIASMGVMALLAILDYWFMDMPHHKL
jgi:hypothetical protein